MNLTEYAHSDYADAHGISNEMGPNEIERAAKFLINMVEPLELLFHPHTINFHSGYRSLALNSALPGSSKTSQHMQANALDFDVSGLSLADAYRVILHSSLRFDQLLLEGREGHQWCHISYNTDKSGSEQRMDAKELPNA